MLVNKNECKENTSLFFKKSVKMSLAYMNRSVLVLPIS